MKWLKKIRDYLCYCGIEKKEYDAVKKDAYISNWKVWKLLHCLMVGVFGFLFVNSLFNDLLIANRTFYLILFVYSIIMTIIFFFINNKSIIAQFLIYLSIIALFLFGCFITQNKPQFPATTFIVMLIVTPMFMIDKPFYMGIVLFVASSVYLVWMRQVKAIEIWEMDLVNIIMFSVVGFFIHIITNSIRIKEFVLTRKINIQKDIDDLTGIMNKGALTHAINTFLNEEGKDQGIMFLLDIDHFKSINDNFGHDVGDSVIRQMAAYLKEYFGDEEIVGRFGGDEFIFFVRNTDSEEIANKIASEITNNVSKHIKLSVDLMKVEVSIGISIYKGKERNYSEIFKKADIALYDVKSNPNLRYKIFRE